MDAIGLDQLERTADGACAVDRHQRIIRWNRAAESLLGFRAADVLGKRCFETFCGTDEDGVQVCRHGCPLFEHARQDEVVPTVNVRVRTRDGEERWISLSTVPGANDESLALLHLFRDVTRFKTYQTVVELLQAGIVRPATGPAPDGDDDLDGAGRGGRLTRREHEVLRHLAAGRSTNAIAEALFVSPSTVRNHVHNILEKLHVHSRLEAVMHAARHGLL
jgi:PAS domain S-box-containing protein